MQEHSIQFHACVIDICMGDGVCNVPALNRALFLYFLLCIYLYIRTYKAASVFIYDDRICFVKTCVAGRCIRLGWCCLGGNNVFERNRAVEEEFIHIRFKSNSVRAWVRCADYLTNKQDAEIGKLDSHR